jgi:hypothetical protein
MIDLEDLQTYGWSVVQIHTSPCGQVSVRLSLPGLARHARGEIVGCVPLSMAVRRVDEVVGNAQGRSA